MKNPLLQPHFRCVAQFFSPSCSELSSRWLSTTTSAVMSIIHRKAATFTLISEEMLNDTRMTKNRSRRKDSGTCHFNEDINNSNRSISSLKRITNTPNMTMSRLCSELLLVLLLVFTLFSGQTSAYGVAGGSGGSAVASHHRSHSECKFPEHWWGSWFQRGVPDLIYISKHNISEKGVCRMHVGDRYLIENRAERCVRCLVISEKHPNVLQYKESWCEPVGSKLSLDICLEINGDAPLFSLFRANTSPIKCPFSGPYLFSYSKNNNECREAKSEMDECTDDKRRLLKFKACADVYGSESKVEELECVADWKEGTYKYLVAKLNHSLASSDEDKFRCFIIERNGGDDALERYTIGQSGDASCDGLFSPRDGVRTLKLQKTAPIAPRCAFPEWLARFSFWKTLDYRNHYDFSARQLFTVLDDKKDVLRRSKCIATDDVSFAFGFNATRFVIHTTFGCQSGFACMHVYLRETRIVELQMGKIVSHVSDACLPQNFNPRTLPFTTLTTFDDFTRECPLKGVFSIKSSRYADSYGYAAAAASRYHNYSRPVWFLDSRLICQERAFRLKANCEDPDQFQLSCGIDNRVKNFKCRGGWRENNSQMFLVSFLEKFNYQYCINYNLDTNEIRMVKHSHFCYRSAPPFPADDVIIPPSSAGSTNALQYHQQPPHRSQQYGVQRTGRTFPVIDYGNSNNNNNNNQFHREEPVALTLINEGYCSSAPTSVLSPIQLTIVIVTTALLSIFTVRW